MLAQASRRDDPLRPARLAGRARHGRAPAAARAVASRVGHAFIKHRMREEDALFAGEVSGHYYFRDFYGVDTGIVPGAGDARAGLAPRRLAGRAAARRCASATTSPARSTRRVARRRRSSCRSSRSASARAPRSAHLDGVSIDFPDWHFNVRPSNTEPLLRLNLEAYTRGRHGAPARRGARRHPRRGLSVPGQRRCPTGDASGRRSASRPRRASASTRPTPRASSTTAATCRTSTAPASSTCATSSLLRHAPGAFTSS